MSMAAQFRDHEALRAVAWKASSPTLPNEARASARYVRDGREEGPLREICLPLAHSPLNLLPEVRSAALALFAELGIPWHQSVEGGPTNHLLSSQVQCVNALGQMVADADRLRRAFQPLLDTHGVFEIEPGRFLTFEYIGPTDYFGEGAGQPRIRGSMCTSVDAAFLHRTGAGVKELVLLEWKYVEAYGPRTPEPSRDHTRRRRYEPALTAPDSPIRADLVPFDAFLGEPLYQLMRQQLLARALERDRAHGADVVRVVHVHPAANQAYQQSLHRDDLHRLGDSVGAVWSTLLVGHDRFTGVDNSHFLDPAVTSPEYVSRYGGGSIGGAS